MVKANYYISGLFFAAAGIGLCAEDAVDLGNVMFIGDSITHGFKSHSYRWPLHKTLVDNGVVFVAVGVHEGNAFKEGSVAPGTEYAGACFNNRHSAMSSERAYEIAGRINTSGRLGNSNIHDWLGLDAAYTGKFRLNMPQQTPDTVVMMIGTNDTFGDYGNKGGIGARDNMQKAQRNLLGSRSDKGAWSGDGDLDVIIDALRRVNPQVRILLLTIPTWHDARRNNNNAADYAALASYNEALKEWCKFKRLECVDVNTALVNPARVDKPGVAEIQFFHPADRLHPTPQGDLLIAEMVANALGCSGRTADLPRRSSADFERRATASGNAWTIPADALSGVRADAGFTVALKATVGNGAADGWIEDKGLCVTCAHASAGLYGRLLVSESAVVWGENKVLWCGDMSANGGELRVVWHPGKPADNIAQGFYVWLGDRLIGEALPTLNSLRGKLPEGVCADSAGFEGSIGMQSLRLTPGSYAPEG